MSRDRIRPVVSALTCACTLVVLVGAAPFPGPSVADAAVLTWSADAPFADASTIAVDFGATLTGVTALEAVVTGMGGVQHWIIYQGVGNPTGSVPFNMALDCRDQGTDDGVAGASAWLPLLKPFAESFVFAPATDWTFLQDGAFTLGVTYVHAPFPDVPMCYGTGYTLPVVDHIELIVTCDAAVATAHGSWGAVKAAFR